MLRALLDTLVPHRCLACGARDALPWCRSCAAEASRLRVRRACRRCGAGQGGEHPCWSRPSPIDATTVAFDYRGVVAASVVAAKVRGAAAAWPELGAELARSLDAAAAGAADAVTWVPADRRRRRERGVDHAAELARPVAGRLDRPLARLLAARPGRPDQATRPADERRAVPLGAFRATTRLEGAVVLLVDDVITTGATAWAAAAALRRAGADVVTLAVLARAGDHELGPQRPPDPPAPPAGAGASVV